MLKNSRTIQPHDIDPLENLDQIIAIDPSSVQLRLWHGQMQHDLGAISSKQLALLECQAGKVAGSARTIYNPFTGEIRKAFLPDWVGKHRPEDAPQVGWTKPVAPAIVK